MVYITGDTHGDPARFSSKGAKQLGRGDTLFILGDFGFIWNGSKEEQQRLKKLGEKKYTIAFLDGRHENYTLLAQYSLCDWNGGRARHISGNLYHLQRGEIYTVEGKTFLTIGGGESPDHDIRMESGTFWEEEIPTAADMQNAADHLAERNHQVDYILTHEPSGKANGYLSLGTPVNGVHLLLNPLEERVQFTRWYFGALHLDRQMSDRHRAVFQEIVPVKELQPTAKKGKSHT